MKNYAAFLASLSINKRRSVFQPQPIIERSVWYLKSPGFLLKPRNSINLNNIETVQLIDVFKIPNLLTWGEEGVLVFTWHICVTRNYFQWMIFCYCCIIVRKRCLCLRKKKTTPNYNRKTKSSLLSFSGLVREMYVEMSLSKWKEKRWKKPLHVMGTCLPKLYILFILENFPGYKKLSCKHQLVERKYGARNMSKEKQGVMSNNIVK